MPDVVLFGAGFAIGWLLGEAIHCIWKRYRARR